MGREVAGGELGVWGRERENVELAVDLDRRSLICRGGELGGLRGNVEGRGYLVGESK